LPIPTDNSYNSIFGDKYKNEILNIVESMMTKFFLKENEGKENSLLFCKQRNFIIESKKIIHKVNLKNEKSENFSYLSVKNKIIKTELNLENDNFSIYNFKAKFSPKQIKISDEDLNHLPPFSTRSLFQKKKDILMNLKTTQEDLISIIPYKKEIKINEAETQTESLHQFKIEQNIKLNFIKNKINNTNNETQTFITKFDIEKLNILNEEYSQQLVIYQREKEESDLFYKKELEFLKNEIKKKDEQLNDNNSDKINIFMYPEIIPPEQTFKIFLRKYFIK
jgi:hypothetical protein